jgi:hypothetical protein
MFRPRLFAVAVALALPLAIAPSALAQDTTPTIPGVNPLKPIFLCNNLLGGTCIGTPRGDTLIGGQGVDRIFGVGGDDDIEQNLVFVSGASDEAHGGLGRDCIDGGGGTSRQFGDEGDDNVPCEFTAFVDPQAALTSGPGPDVVHGGTGNDSMDGIFDSDKLYGDQGNDLINDPYPLDRDELYGGPGSDTLNAADGGNDDIIDGDGPYLGDTSLKNPTGGNLKQGGGSTSDVDTCYGDPGDTFVNCERIIRSAVPLLISPNGPVPLPRALVEFTANPATAKVRPQGS